MRAPLSMSILAVSLLTALPGCNSTSRIVGPPDPTPQLIVAPGAATIQSGTRFQLALSARDANGQKATASNVAWITSEPSVAAVAGDGMVTGLAPGATKITAWWNGVYGTSTVTVTPGSASCAPPPSKHPDLVAKPACIK